MELNVIGLNHKTASLNLRERFAFSSDITSSLLIEFQDKCAREVVILSTCNRTEIYYYAGDKNNVLMWLAVTKNVPVTQIKSHTYHYSNLEAVKHAYKVACGLDSMILGETQILGQMKQAAKLAEFANTQGKHLRYLFQKIFETAKEVRTKTKIGASSTTVASSILKVSKSIFGDITQTSILFVGAGDMAELCAKYFTDQNPRQLTIANRSIEKGKMLAEKINCQSILLGDVHQHISNYDIVICSTSSQLPIIGMGMIQNALQARKHKPMLLVDLAIPRDVEIEIGTLDDIFLYTFDDLAKLAQEGVKNRESEIIKATKIIEEKVQIYREKIEQKTIIPTINLLRNHFERIRKEELLKAEKEINKGASIDEVMDKLSKTLSKKYLHHPTKVFNEFSNQKLEKALAILKKIYKIED
jgi:glutamyl-tRNA reductase